MCKSLRFVLLVPMTCQLCWATQSLAEDANWVRVVPKETNEILANPGMGWETFHRTADNDKNLPAWIPSTIHYARWGWKVLEPEKGKIDYDFLDGALKETRESGQQLAFRVMCCSPYPRPDNEHFRQELERFLRRLGYRLVLKELRHSKEVKQGETLKLAMKWQNVGSAPCYRPYRLAYRLSDSDGDHQVFVGNVTVNRWMPGEIELFTEEFFKQPADLPPGEVVDVAESIRLSNDLSQGTYTLSIAVVGEKEDDPVVQLGIEGRCEDGWYRLSAVTISR